MSERGREGEGGGENLEGGTELDGAEAKECHVRSLVPLVLHPVQCLPRVCQHAHTHKSARARERERVRERARERERE